MRLTRKYLESRNIEADDIDAIIGAHAETVEALKGQIDALQTEADKYTATRRELDTLTAELESIKAVGGDWKAKYEKVNADFEAFKTEQSARETLSNQIEAYKGILKSLNIGEDTISNPIFDNVIKDKASKSIVFEDGKIVDEEATKERIASEWEKFKPVISTQGAQTTTPPATAPMRKFSYEELKTMSPEEVNANWGAICESGSLKEL